MELAITTIYETYQKHLTAVTVKVYLINFITII